MLLSTTPRHLSAKSSQNFFCRNVGKYGVLFQDSHHGEKIEFVNKEKIKISGRGRPWLSTTPYVVIFLPFNYSSQSLYFQPFKQALYAGYWLVFFCLAFTISCNRPNPHNIFPYYQQLSKIASLFSHQHQIAKTTFFFLMIFISFKLGGRIQLFQ